MSVDPLTAFVARSLRAEVSDVRSELVTKNALMEVERIRFKEEGEDRSLTLKRVPPTDALEVQLLPFLSRKTDRVPRVFSRGIPPATTPAWPWVMTEDVLDATSACHEDARAIVLTKVAIERATASDAPALAALGVKTLTPLERVERAAERAALDRPIDEDARAAAAALAEFPLVLCHGELTCAHARSSKRGVLVVEWRRAHLGCGLIDVAELAEDARRFHGTDAGAKLFELYGELTGIRVHADEVRAARLIAQVVRS
ncbi:MAG TPA: hypothetical protein VIA63_08035 [Candidatus Limnocylindria bacterium]